MIDVSVTKPTSLRISFVGLSKNAGKTTALLWFVDAWRSAGRSVGLVSIGIDGEHLDAWHGTPKPRIRVERGDLVVTSRPRQTKDDAKLSAVTATHGPSRWQVWRVAHPGNVVLSGVRDREELRMAVLELEREGAERIALDGAFDRLAHASPTVSDGVVLSVGLSAGTGLEEVVARTQSLLWRLQLPVAESSATSPLATEPAVRDCAALGVHTLVVPDGTCVFVDAEAVRRAGLTLAVHQAIRVRALTCNPTSPSGVTILPDLMVQRLSDLTNLPTLDVVAGLCGPPNLLPSFDLARSHIS